MNTNYLVISLSDELNFCNVLQTIVFIYLVLVRNYNAKKSKWQLKLDIHMSTYKLCAAFTWIIQQICNKFSYRL
jgi:hypothetical protein